MKLCLLPGLINYEHIFSEKIGGDDVVRYLEIAY